MRCDISEEMNFENPESNLKFEVFEKESEIPPVGFSDYSSICNLENDCFQKKGIQLSSFYESILSDDTTNFININTGRTPFLVDIKYGFSMGYDTAKCEKFASEFNGDKLILSFSIDKLTDSERHQIVNIIKSRDDFSVYFTDHEGRDMELLISLIEEAGKNYTEEALCDNRLEGEDAQAAMYLYACNFNQRNQQTNNLRLRDVVEYYKSEIGPVYSRDNNAVTRLDLGSSISNEIFDKIWELYDERFENLGSYMHPISMQDSKDDFARLIQSNSTMVAATYVKGESGEYDNPVCFTFFMDNFENLYWLNENYIANINQFIGDSCNTPLFIPGLVSSSEYGSLSALPMSLSTRAGCEAGMSATIFYESTNMSKNYIPKIVDRCIARACVDSDYTKASQIDKVIYRLFHIK